MPPRSRYASSAEFATSGDVADAIRHRRFRLPDRGRLAYGPRSTLGFFLTPLSTANHWGRDVFAFALALQNLLWGVGPAVRRHRSPTGSARSGCFAPARCMYALGLVLMAYATSAPMLDLSAGVLIGFGLAGSSFMMVLAAFGKLLPPQWRSLAFGAARRRVRSANSCYSPLAVAAHGSLRLAAGAC